MKQLPHEEMRLGFVQLHKNDGATMHERDVKYVVNPNDFHLVLRGQLGPAFVRPNGNCMIDSTVAELRLSEVRRLSLNGGKFENFHGGLLTRAVGQHRQRLGI
jgi:hypothetical protein